MASDKVRLSDASFFYKNIHSSEIFDHLMIKNGFDILFKEYCIKSITLKNQIMRHQDSLSKELQMFKIVFVVVLIVVAACSTFLLQPI